MVGRLPTRLGACDGGVAREMCEVIKEGWLEGELASRWLMMKEEVDFGGGSGRACVG